MSVSKDMNSTTTTATIDARIIPSNTTTWLTPRWLLDSLGAFDLDPCCPPVMPWQTAKRMIHYPREAGQAGTEIDQIGVEDGLLIPWFGRVWLNPPYGREIEDWMKKMAEHNNGVALVFARTDAKWFQRYVFGKATSLLFLNKRVSFCNPDGTKGGRSASPSVLAFYGGEQIGLHHLQALGTMVNL